MKTNMKDRQLSMWTANAPECSGFYVATINDVVVGTVAYKTESSSTLEMFRLSVDKDFRKLGVAAALVLKMETVAKEIGCEVVEAVTSDPQIAAMKFYPRQGYHLESCNRYLSGTDFIHLVAFRKSLQ